MTGLGEDARQDYAEARHDWDANFGILKTPQLAGIHEELDQIVATNRQDPDRVRGAAVIDALPGLGKTTIANSFARGFDRTQIRRHGERTGEGHERLPVLRVGLTSKTTLRTLNRMICEFYGHPGTTGRTHPCWPVTPWTVSCPARPGWGSSTTSTSSIPTTRTASRSAIT